MTESEGIKRLRQLVGRKNRLSAEINQQTAALLTEGEFIEDIAGALGESRETVRRFRDKHKIPDTREIRRANGLPPRRSPSA